MKKIWETLQGWFLVNKNDQSRSREEGTFFNVPLSLSYFWKHKGDKFLCVHSIDANKFLLDTSIYVCFDDDDGWHCVNMRGLSGDIEEVFKERDEVVGNEPKGDAIASLTYWTRNLSKEEIDRFVRDEGDGLPYYE